jgi:hypothetical protein
MWQRVFLVSFSCQSISSCWCSALLTWQLVAVLVCRPLVGAVYCHCRVMLTLHVLLVLILLGLRA